MSATAISSAVSAFNEVLDVYYQARLSSASGTKSMVGFSNIAISVRSNGGNIVRVCPSDLIADFELAGKRALEGLANEYHVFQRVYLDRDAGFEEKLQEHMSPAVYSAIIKQIEQRVGEALVTRNIWPINVYAAAVIR